VVATAEMVARTVAEMDVTAENKRTE
jgi:hypothetical protein